MFKHLKREISLIRCAKNKLLSDLSNDQPKKKNTNKLCAKKYKIEMCGMRKDEIETQWTRERKNHIVTGCWTRAIVFYIFHYFHFSTAAYCCANLTAMKSSNFKIAVIAKSPLFSFFILLEWAPLKLSRGRPRTETLHFSNEQLNERTAFGDETMQ